MTLLTELELADKLRLPVEKVAELRRKKQWPHVRLGRFDVRYTEAQVEQIIAMQSRSSSGPVKPSTGQTQGSARRSA